MRRGIVFPFLIATIVLILDQLTKYVISTYLKTYESIRVFPFFQIVHVRNKGAAFGMFQNLGNTVFIGISLVAIIIVVVMIIKSKDDRIAFSLILGGALGNLIDRLIRGYVVDFLDFYAGQYHWPAFNIADSALTIGIVFLFIGAFYKEFYKLKSRK